MLKKIFTNNLLQLVDLELEVEKYPPLSLVEKAQLDQTIAIEQLYNSSKLEGSNLTKEMIDKAIHG